MSKKPVSPVKKNLSRAFLITGMVFSILAFAFSLGLFALYFGAYALVLIVLLVIAAVILLGFGVILLFIYLIVGFFAALFGATNFDFLDKIFPSNIEQILPMDLIERFGYDSLLYLIGLPIVVTMVIVSFISMVFAIVALVMLNNAQSKGPGIVGGVFGILSSITGIFNVFEFVGAVLMFFISKDEYMIGHEEKKTNPIDNGPKLITMK